MTTVFYRMPRLILVFLLLSSTVSFLSSCTKTEEADNKKPSKYSAEVLDKWMTLQLRLLRNATGVSNHGLARPVAYSGVAAIQALEPGLSSNKKWQQKWNGLTGLPLSAHKKDYYYPANVNAAMAAINKAFFANASSTDKAAIDSLESALNNQFLLTQSAEEINNSATFGKAVATAVFNWAETDGYKDAAKPYNVPTGEGMWKPTPPAQAPPVTPYWGNNRTIIRNSTAGTALPAPTTYSTANGSAFYQMVKQVFDVSQTLTEDQKAMAFFWRDVPGATTPGHWLSIVQQVVRQTSSSLEKAALAYALTGSAINDALITCFKAKYQYTLLRPVTYIKEVMGHSGWNSLLGNPAHPEYSSAHSSLSVAAAEVLQKLFGNIGSFTDHTNDYLGMQPRTFNSFAAIGNEAAQSRLYAGIHYQLSIDAGKFQGSKVAANIFDGLLEFNLNN